MLYQIASFLLDVIGGLLTGACLLRLYMQWQRIPFSNPLGRVVFAFSDWLIMPLRRVIPAVGRWDVSSLAAAMLLQIAQYSLWALVVRVGAAWTWLPWLALLGLVRVAVAGLAGLLIIYAVMSWVQARSQLADVIARLCEPVLRPFRRIIPSMGGIDLSPLVVLVLLQVAMIVLRHLEMGVLR